MLLYSSLSGAALMNAQYHCVWNYLHVLYSTLVQHIVFIRSFVMYSTLFIQNQFTVDRVHTSLNVNLEAET